MGLRMYQWLVAAMVALSWIGSASAALVGLDGQAVVVTESLSGAKINDTQYPAPAVRTYNGVVSSDYEFHPGNGPASTLGYGLFAGVDIDPVKQEISFGMGGYCVGCGVTEQDWIIKFEFPNLTGVHVASVQHLHHNSAFAGADVVAFTDHSLTVDLSGLYVMYSCAACYYKFDALFGYTLAADQAGGGGGGAGAGGNDVPEPGSLALFGLALACVNIARRKSIARRKQA